MIVYKAINKKNNKSYIGITIKPLSVRIRGHIKASKNPIQHFARAIHKYGLENFTWEIINSDATSVDHLKQLEIWYIEHLKPEYNMTKGGDGRPNCNASEITRKKISKANMGNKYRLGMSHSEETKKKISKANANKKYHLGFKHSDESKRKMALAKIGKPSPIKGRKLKVI